MVKTNINECVNCGLPCLGNMCPNRNVIRFYCDKCGDEAETLYEYDGMELCESCVLDELPKVN